MAFQVFFAANSILISSFYSSPEKLLAYRAGISGLCIGNTESPICCHVLKGKGDHLNRSHSYTQYTQLVFSNLHNLDDANERLPNTRITISPTIPPCCLTQARKKTHLVWRFKPFGKRQRKPTLPKSSLLQVGCFFGIQYHVGSYEWGPSPTHS